MDVSLELSLEVFSCVPLAALVRAPPIVRFDVVLADMSLPFDFRLEQLSPPAVLARAVERVVGVKLIDVYLQRFDRFESPVAAPWLETEEVLLGVLSFYMSMLMVSSVERLPRSRTVFVHTVGRAEAVSCGEVASETLGIIGRACMTFTVRV